MVGFVMRFESQMTIVRELIDAGFFGDLYYSKAIYTRRAGNPGGWYSNRKFSGGGPLLDVGVHVVDACHYILGKPAVQRVSAQTFDKIGPRYNVKAIDRYKPSGVSADDIEDMCVSLVYFQNGGVMEVETSYSHHIKEDTCKIEVYGTKGSFIYDYEPNIKVFSEIHNYLADISLVCPPEDDDESFAREIKNFVDSMDDPSLCVAPGADGAEVTRILEAIYKSAELKKEVIFE